MSADTPSCPSNTATLVTEVYHNEDEPQHTADELDKEEAYRQKGVAMKCCVLLRDSSHMPEYGLCAVNTPSAAALQPAIDSALSHSLKNA